MEQNNIKKKAILNKINNYVEKVLSEAEEQNTIDYFKIEINNHKGTLQMDFQLRSREKAY